MRIATSWRDGGVRDLPVGVCRGRACSSAPIDEALGASAIRRAMGAGPFSVGREPIAAARLVDAATAPRMAQGTICQGFLLQEGVSRFMGSACRPVAEVEGHQDSEERPMRWPCHGHRGHQRAEGARAIAPPGVAMDGSAFGGPSRVWAMGAQRDAQRGAPECEKRHHAIVPA